MILEYFSFGKGSFNRTLGKARKIPVLYFKIIASYLTLSGMLWVLV
jgi:hypothetical protein